MPAPMLTKSMSGFGADWIMGKQLVSFRPQASDEAFDTYLRDIGLKPAAY